MAEGRLRRFLALAAPTTLLAAAQAAAQLVEPWLAARQGTPALAGWAVVLPFALLLGQMSAGAMGGGVVLMAAVVMAGGAGFTPHLMTPLRGALFARILSVGLVACAMATIANLATILATARIAAHGPAVVAGYGISARMEFLMIPLAFGLGSALTALVGRAVGAGDWAGARRIAWTGGLLALGVTGAVALPVALFPAATAAAFTADPAVQAVAAEALGIIGWAMPGFGIGMALYFAAMGAGRMAWPVAAALARIGLAVGGGWLLADVAGFGLTGQFVAVALGITAYGAICAAAVRPGVWSGR